MTDKVEISKIASETVSVPIIGTSPLIVHRFSEKAKKAMLDNMQGRRTPKENKDPQVEYEAAFYRLKDGRAGLPCLAFKAATIGACRFYGKAVTMAATRQCVFFHGEIGQDGQQLVAVEGEPQLREDVVTVGQSGHDLRYRPEFPEWSTVLTVTYVTSSLSRDSILSLIDAGGMGCGVGEWRVERKGDFGCYRIDPSRTVEVIG